MVIRTSEAMNDVILVSTCSEPMGAVTSHLILLLVERHGDGYLQVVLLLYVLFFAGGGGGRGTERQLGLVCQGAAQVLRWEVAAGVRVLATAERGARERLSKSLADSCSDSGVVSQQHSRFVQVFIAQVADSSLLLDAKVRQGRSLARALGTDTLPTVAAVVLQ